MTLRATTGILSEIVAHKHSELRQLAPLHADLERRAYGTRGQRRPFLPGAAVPFDRNNRGNKESLTEQRPAAAGFSSGNDRPGLRIGRRRVSFRFDGSALFQGSLNDLQTARNATALPALRKEFTIDRLQIFESAAHGADALLLIAAILDVQELRSFRELATELGLAALVEVHNEAELERAIDSGAEIIGVNNRNLETFEVSLDVSLRLSGKMPDTFFA